MTDEPLLAKKLAFIATCVTELRTVARNVLVHGYTDVDLGIVRDVVLNRLVDLDDFVTAARNWPAPS